MPLGGPYLNNGQLAFIEKWILDGAPENGIVSNPNLLSDDTMYESQHLLRWNLSKACNFMGLLKLGQAVIENFLLWAQYI